jgi:methyl-accepting chemotaxis protein-2 (aspartate sensor receptor)
MLSFLSSTQRALLTLILLVAGQACVAIGLNAGWSSTAVIASSLTLTAIGAAIYLSGLSVLRSFLVTFSAHARRLSEGDLSVDINIEGGNSDSAAVLRSLQTLQTELRRSISAIRTGADGVTVAATEIASGNQDLSGRTEQTASNLQQAASSMSQLNGTVRQSADAAAQANQLASSATQVARRGGEVVSRVVTTMDEINASSKKIADIIGVIDGIAFQTNILALNAAVEAARAGEQGRGFAVVAGEVRSLAGRSAEAAREIKTLIGASVDRVESGTRLVQDAGATMNEIVSSVQRVSDIIGEISAAATEQSIGIGQVNGAVVQLDQMTQQNAALVEESAAAAESLKDQANRLAGVVAGFRLGGQADVRQAAPRHSAPAARPATAAPAKASVKASAPAKPKTAAPLAAPKPVAAAPAPATAEHGDWETF